MNEHDHDDEHCDLEEGIEAGEARSPGYRQRLDELGEVFRMTTALWQECERQGLSVEEVARRSRLTLDQVEAIEDNDLDAPLDHLARYARAVGLSFELHRLSA
ncbi:MAG: helix-turn-helix domain-containing protein [Acidimicrobiales bacterium]